MQIHSRQVKIAYALAVVPAVFLPFSYLVMAVWVLICSVSGRDMGDANWYVRWIIATGVIATFVQWPFYFVWAARTRQLTFRVRMLWISVLFIMNMFAMPWFLFCMYRGTAQTALTRGIRHESIRRFFEKGTVA